MLDKSGKAIIMEKTFLLLVLLVSVEAESQNRNGLCEVQNQSSDFSRCPLLRKLVGNQACLVCAVEGSSVILSEFTSCSKVKIPFLHFSSGNHVLTRLLCSVEYFRKTIYLHSVHSTCCPLV